MGAWSDPGRGAKETTDSVQQQAAPYWFPTLWSSEYSTRFASHF
jgi:hypothetical protein